MKPEELKYAETHEWVSVTDGVATIGISDFAVKQLTDLVFMELPEVGATLAAGDSIGEIESVKAVSDMYSPVAGEVVEVNSSLPDQLETLSTDPYGAGWVVKIKIADEAGLEKLMDHAAYTKQCAAEG
ncbi:MAG: glycine cleavage system protein GcvH [Planctomycetota bacterium]